ncbi:putative holin-like toxin [Tumebacillus avium]
MTDYQWLTVMIGFGSLIAAVIFGVLSVVIAILNLLKKK